MTRVLEELVYEDREVRQKVRTALEQYVCEIMQGYRDYRDYSQPLSQNENYLIGWRMAETGA